MQGRYSESGRLIHVCDWSRRPSQPITCLLDLGLVSSIYLDFFFGILANVLSVKCVVVA